MNRIDFMIIPEIGELQTGPHVVSLWDVLSSMLQGPAEVDFVRQMLGDIIGDNQSAAQELRTLLEILGDLRSAQTEDVASPAKPVPLASANKELLQERLRQLIVNARTPPEDMFKTPRDRQIAEYIIRPSSSVSSRSRSHDSRPTSVGSSSSRSSFVDPTKNLAPLRGSLRFDKVSEVKPSIVECFHVEYQQIVADVEFVRELIDTEMQSRCTTREPTVGELKDLTKTVEEAELHLAHVEMIQRLPVPTKRGSLASLK